MVAELGSLTQWGSAANFWSCLERSITGPDQMEHGAAAVQGRVFKGRQFTAGVIPRAARCYLMFPVSYRDFGLMLLDRGAAAGHTTVFRWIQAYAAELEKRIRLHLRLSNGSWRVDETYVKGWRQRRRPAGPPTLFRHCRPAPPGAARPPSSRG